MTSFYKFKPEVTLNDLENANPKLLIVLGYFGLFCQEHTLPCLITSLFTDAVKIRSSSTHRDGRAFDASIRGFTDEDIKMLVEYMEDKVGSLGAISLSDNIRRVVICHGGTARHLHFQVSP